MKSTQFEILDDNLRIINNKMDVIISDLKIINQKLYAIEDKVGYDGMKQLGKKYLEKKKPVRRTL